MYNVIHMIYFSIQLTKATSKYTKSTIILTDLNLAIKVKYSGFIR